MASDYYKTKESVEEYIKLAQGVNGSELIAQFKSYLASGSTILEIGSGPGTDWNILASDFNAVGSDNSEEFLNHLISKNPQGRFLNLDAVTLKTNEKFDGIYSNKALHHLDHTTLRDSIKRQSEILNPNGIICHSFWKGDGSEIFKGLFVNYHSENTLIDFFADRFEILRMESYTEFDPDDSLLFIGKKKD